MVTGGGNVGVVAGTVSLPGSPSSCLQTVGTVSTAATVASETSVAVLPARRTSENRRSNKPIMEKRRRARINNCLNELKTLILDAMKKDPARHSKLEKADILEMTVKHLETLQRQQVAMSAATDPSVVNKFRAGFSECAGEVGRFPGLDSPVRRRLLQHLSNCINGSSTTTTTPENPTTSTQHAVQVHILPSPSSEGHPTQTTSANGIFFSTGGTGGGLQLVPTRLPNGDIALVLPATSSGTQIFRQTVASSPASSPAPSTSSSSSTSPLPMLVPTSSPLPMLIPIPSRTSSSGSASSSSVSSSSCISTSPVAFDRLSVQSPPADHRPVYSPPLQKPLALVMRKTCPERQCEEEKPWRPW